VEAENLTGTYTYRSFLDRAEPVDDFNRLRFAQLELHLSVDPGGIISGALLFPTPPGSDPQGMDLDGQLSESTLKHFSFSGRGRPNSQIADFHYEYDGIVLHHWENGIDQRLTLAGTVVRAADHGSGATLARAGQTASFLAVQREPTSDQVR
jgi:hypothetical protein